MKFCKIIPADRLRPYIKHFTISQNADEHTYKVFPSTGLVLGFQYKGQLAFLKDNTENILATAGITGLCDSYKIFRNSPDTGTILVFFTEVGITYFSNISANELFNQCVSLHNLFNKAKVSATEEKLAGCKTDKERINVIEQFLLTEIKDRKDDKLIIEAIRLIYQSKGLIKIKELNEKLFISPSPFEKRFRKIVGTSPKKFASIVRFNAVLNNMSAVESFTKLCYDNNFFDQAHFIKDFKQYTGETPENFKRFILNDFLQF